MKFPIAILTATAALTSALATDPLQLNTTDTDLSQPQPFNETLLDGYSVIISNKTATAFNAWCQNHTYFCSRLYFHYPDEGVVIDPRIEPKQLPRAKKQKLTTVTATATVTAKDNVMSTAGAAPLGRRFAPGHHISDHGHKSDLVRPQHPDWDHGELKLCFPFGICFMRGQPCVE